MLNFKLAKDMNTLTIWRYRYTQFFVICILSMLIYIMCQSLDGGISQLESNIWGRNLLISKFANLRLKMGDRVFSQGLVGKDGWLQFTAGGILDDFQNTMQFSPKNIQQNSQLLYEKLQAQNITLVIIIVPNKDTIYPEQLPDEIQKINEQSRLDLLVAYFKKYGPPVLIDLRPALQRARQEETIYYKTDTHWNNLGSFAAYSEVMQVLSRSNP